MTGSHSTDDEVLARITMDPTIFGGKPIIRGHRLAVEHVLGMLAAGTRPRRSSKDIPGLKRRISEHAWFTLVASSVMNALDPELPAAEA